MLMPNRAYSQDFRLRACALAAVRSIPIAAKELGIGEDTLTRWVAKQPTTPALEQAVNLALSELTARMAVGTLSPRDLTVAYGVLRDKQARYGQADAAAPHVKDAVELWGDHLEAALGKRFRKDADLALIAVVYWMEDLPEGTPGPSVAQCMAYAESLGDLNAWRTRHDAERHDAMVTQLAQNQAAANAVLTAALDEETRQLIAAAELWLAQHAEEAS